MSKRVSMRIGGRLLLLFIALFIAAYPVAAQGNEAGKNSTLTAVKSRKGASMKRSKKSRRISKPTTTETSAETQKSEASATPSGENPATQIGITLNKEGEVGAKAKSTTRSTDRSSVRARRGQRKRKSVPARSARAAQPSSEAGVPATSTQPAQPSKPSTPPF